MSGRWYESDSTAEERFADRVWTDPVSPWSPEGSRKWLDELVAALGVEAAKKIVLVEWENGAAGV